MFAKVSFSLVFIFSFIACKDSGCKKCTAPDTTNKCQECFTGYLKSGSTCNQCTSPCKTCTSSVT